MGIRLEVITVFIFCSLITNKLHFSLYSYPFFEFLGICFLFLQITFCQVFSWCFMAEFLMSYRFQSLVIAENVLQSLCQRNGSVGESTCCQGWGPSLSPQDQVPKSYALTSTSMHGTHVHTHVHTHKHTHITHTHPCHGTHTHTHAHTHPCHGTLTHTLTHAWHICTHM